MVILVIEDDPRIVRFLQRGLAASGHQVQSASDGLVGALAALDDSVELVILDLSLPGLDGQDVLARIRSDRPGLPVLVLTARDSLESKVKALGQGADDYLLKPFAFEELRARILALTRRSDQRQGSQLELGDLRVDLLGHRAWRGDRPIDLSSREFALLVYLMRHPGQVLSREQLLSAVWAYDFDPTSNVVDVYIRYLRRKIDRPAAPSLIGTIRGVGYRFEPAPSDH
jgi:DNA-binding response OmpR family regulator